MAAAQHGLDLTTWTLKVNTCGITLTRLWSLQTGIQTNPAYLIRRMLSLETALTCLGMVNGMTDPALITTNLFENKKQN